MVAYATTYKYKEQKYTAIFIMDRIERLKAFLTTNPNDCFIKHALALEYVKLNDEVTAKSLFEEVLQTDANYIGSYYHLGKLLERINDSESALSIYQQGMQKAQELGDRHAYGELRGAYEELADI
jgi:tetratricopeptide (TPR) repeat protein